MKPIFMLIIIMMGYCGYSQNKLSFTYDAAGNQTQRELICVSCTTPAARPGPSGVDAQTENEEEKLTQSAEYEEISYYPNPVQEQLYIKWYSNENVYVTSLQVYAMSGQLITTQNNLNSKNTAIVEFQNVTEGMYNVILIYNNGETKILKVIKK